MKDYPFRLVGYMPPLVFLAVARLSLAQASPPPDLMSMDLEHLMNVKVYSASRHLEDAHEAPSAVSVITADEIRRHGWRTLADALRSLRGFYISNDRLYTYLGIRGFLRPGDYNSRILILINGHRTNENVYDSSFVGQEFPVDLDLVDYIEVVRGPGSSVYGTNAVFGVINVITRKQPKQSAVETSGQFAWYNDRLGRLTVQEVHGAVAALLSASLDHNPGRSRLYFPEFASPATNNGYADNMDGDHIVQAFGTVEAGGLSLQALYADRRKNYPTATWDSAFNNPADWIEDIRAYIDAGFSRTLASQTDLQFHAFYDNYDYVGSAAFAKDGSSITALQKARADWVGAEADVSHPMGALRLSAGGEYEYSINVVQRNFIPGEPDAFHSNDSPWLAAAYGEAELRCIPNVILHAGGRVDWYSTFGSAISPRAAVNFTPNAKTTVKYIFGSAFRAPSAYEESYVDDVVIAQAPQKLVPERIHSSELVLEHNLTPRLQLTGDGYYNHLRNLIDEVPDGGTGLNYFVNDGRLHAKGLELEISAERPSGLAAKASYALSTGFNDETETPLANSPRTEFKLNGVMPILQRLSAALDLAFLSALTDYRGTRVPAYLLPNITVFTKTSRNGWTFSASCYDATNKSWYSPMGPNDPEDKIQMNGRTLRFKVDYRLPLQHHRAEP